MKLKKYCDIIFKKNPKQLKKIIFLNNYNYPNKVCDYAIVFGGPYMIPYRADKAILMYQNGLINKIVVTGGFWYLDLKRKEREAISLQRYLIEKNIPKEDIIVEQKARSTKQNVKYTYQLIKDKINENTSFVLISSDYHIKRCLILFKKKFKSNKIFLAPVKDGIADQFHFYKNKRGLRLIIKEALMLTSLE